MGPCDRLAIRRGEGDVSAIARRGRSAIVGARQQKRYTVAAEGGEPFSLGEAAYAEDIQNAAMEGAHRRHVGNAEAQMVDGRDGLSRWGGASSDGVSRRNFRNVAPQWSCRPADCAPIRRSAPRFRREGGRRKVT